ncbi:MAG: DUF5721 family protein [Lachnospiraceae bacterium]|nr:DUF5721 family protein [Lachnospiraceae bacterium]
MKAFSVESTKNFMKELLVGEKFDDFLLEEATIKTYNTFKIDGRILPEFYEDYEFGYEFSLWKNMKGICFDLIKGKQVPVGFHFVLQLAPEKVQQILRLGGSTTPADMVKSFTLNIKYQNNEITLVTATAFNTFIMDKTPDALWDNYIEQFLQSTANL